MSNMRFIAETAFAHEGDANYLSELVERILKSDSDLVKFQVLLQSEHAPDHPMASRCQDLMLTRAEWLAIFEYVRRQGKKVLVLPVDLEALSWVVSERLADLIEVHSVNLFRKDFYELIKKNCSGYEILLSVSGYELDAIDFIVGEYKKIDGIELGLMFGFQSFPTDPSKLALRRISELKRRYGLDVGYADHTSWDVDSTGVLAAAIACGATIVEKHVVLETGRERIDFNSAVDSTHLNELINISRVISYALGDETGYTLHEGEREYGDRRLKLLCEFPISADEEILPPNAVYRWTNAKSTSDEVSGFRLFGERSATRINKGEVIA